MTAREMRWAKLLAAEGHVVQAQKAFGRFNVDLCVPAARVAVEVQNGWHQHKSGRHVERDARKRALVESLGWAYVPVYDRQIGGRGHRALLDLIRSRIV